MSYHPDRPRAEALVDNELPPIRHLARVEPERQLPPLDTNLSDCSRQSCHPRHSLGHHEALYLRNTPVGRLPPTPPEDSKGSLYRFSFSRVPGGSVVQSPPVAQRAEIDAAYGLDTLRRAGSNHGLPGMSRPHKDSKPQVVKEKEAPHDRLDQRAMAEPRYGLRVGEMTGGPFHCQHDHATVPAHLFRESHATHQVSPSSNIGGLFPPSPASSHSPQDTFPQFPTQFATSLDRLPTTTRYYHPAHYSPALPLASHYSYHQKPSQPMHSSSPQFAPHQMAPPSTPDNGGRTVGPIRTTAHSRAAYTAPYPTPPMGSADKAVMSSPQITVSHGRERPSKLTHIITGDGLSLSRAGKIVYRNSTNEEWEQYECVGGICGNGSEHVPPRKVISQFFGRNKASTLAIPSEVIPMLCRKCYQQTTYRSKKDGTYFLDQAKYVKMALERAKSWEGKRTWTIGVTKTLEDALKTYKSSGEPVCYPNQKTHHDLFPFMVDEFAELMGPNKTEDDCLDAIDRVVAAVRHTRSAAELPEVEFLPTGQWPESPMALERKKVLQSYQGHVERRDNGSFTGSTLSEETQKSPAAAQGVQTGHLHNARAPVELTPAAPYDTLQAR